MCTRFYVEQIPFQNLITRSQKLQIADDMMRQLGKPLTMSGELRPTDVAAVLAPNKEGKPAVFPMIWGFTHPAVTAPVFNCRIENVDIKDLWKDSWYRRRCVIPCSWYFEWEHFKRADGKKVTGQKYMMQPKNEESTLLAGLYRFEERNGVICPVFSVITQEAVGDLRKIHDRMPLVLKREDWIRWLRIESDPREISGRALTEICIDKAE